MSGAAPANGAGWQSVGDRAGRTMAPFMEILDSTIVNVSLPHIAGSMSVSSDEATWC